VFNKKSPIIVGVEILEGVLKLGTPLVIPQLEFLDIGIVTSIENNRREVPSAKKGAQVSIKITNDANPTLTFGRQFDHTQPMYSKISRASIDALKEFFKRYVLDFIVSLHRYLIPLNSEVAKEDWQLIIKMKKVFSLP
jgi:translation initiation factor 5B